MAGWTRHRTLSVETQPVDTFKPGTCKSVVTGPPMMIEVEWVAGQPTDLIPAMTGLATPDVDDRVRVWNTGQAVYVDAIYPRTGS